MDSGAPSPRSGSNGFAAYQRESVDRFFSEASEERARLLLEIATARHRIADARAALAEFDESEHACIGAILDAQRALRDERRANERAVAAVHASAEAEAEQLLREARARARYAPLRAVEAEPKVHMNGSAMAGAAVNGRRFATPRFPGDRG